MTLFNQFISNIPLNIITSVQIIHCFQNAMFPAIIRLMHILNNGFVTVKIWSKDRLILFKIENFFRRVGHNVYGGKNTELMCDLCDTIT